MKNKIFSFNIPDEYCIMVRDIIYNRVKDKNFFDSSIQDSEDKVSVLCEIVTNSMSQAFEIGYTLGVKDGENLRKT